MGFEKPFEHSQALLEAALEEFGSCGYAQASLNTILHAAQMSKGQFYYHFKHKADLYLALIGVLIERKRAFLSEHMHPEDLPQDIFAIFEQQIRYGLAFAQTYPAIQRFAERFLQEQGTPIYTQALAVYNFANDTMLDQLLDQAYQRDELRTDLPLPFIKQVISYLFTHAAEAADLHGAADVQSQLHYLISFMRTGLARTT